MAMVKCKECSKEISSSAKKCPECGKDQRNWFAKHKVLTVIGAFIILGAIASAGEDKAKPTSTDKPTPVAEQPQVKVEPTDVTVDETSNAQSTETISQKNALRSAKKYLDYTSFSKKGLIKQLEFEGFGTEDATYGADNCGADWMEQAAKNAKKYLDYSAFSKDGLIKQLEFEGYTSEQAIYGADSTGL